jgi:hypothetical protein
VGYSFIIDDIYRGGDPFGEPEPEFIVRWDTGRVGIGTSTPGAPLDVSANGASLRIFPGFDLTYGANSTTIDMPGSPNHIVFPDSLVVYEDAFKPGGGSWSVLSDARAKRDIEPLCGALDTVLQLQGVTFHYTDEAIASHKGLPGEQIGFIADEVENVLPGWVSRDADGYRYLTERGATAVLVEALRELREEKDRQLAQRDTALAGQQTQIDELRMTVAARETQIADLAARLERLEQFLGGTAGR